MHVVQREIKPLEKLFGLEAGLVAKSIEIDPRAKTFWVLATITARTSASSRARWSAARSWSMTCGPNALMGGRSSRISATPSAT